MAEEAPPSSSNPSNPDQFLPNSQGMDASGSQISQNAIQQKEEEQNGYGPGLYAVPCSPYAGAMAEFPPTMLIPLKYKIPTRTNSTNAMGEEQGQGQEARHQHGPQGQVVVRRFQFALQLDLGLILKLAAVVVLFGQEGSRQRFFLLCFFASLVYLYQTGVFTPLIQYLRRVAGPPPPRRAENPGVARGAAAGDAAANENQNQNQPAEAGEPPAANGNQQEPARANGINWMGIAREIQTFVVGFVASLLPGFHHHDD